MKLLHDNIICILFSDRIIIHRDTESLILLNIINSNYYLMSERININEITRQFMVLDVISRRIEDADKINRTMKMNNAEAAESFKAGSYFSYHFLPKKRRVFMPKGVNADSSAFNLSVGSRRGDYNIDS
jgi:hypothetical protein